MQQKRGHKAPDAVQLTWKRVNAFTCKIKGDKTERVTQKDKIMGLSDVQRVTQVDMQHVTCNMYTQLLQQLVCEHNGKSE